MKKNVLMMLLISFIAISKALAQAPTLTSGSGVMGTTKTGPAGTLITVNGTNLIGVTVVKFGGVDVQAGSITIAGDGKSLTCKPSVNGNSGLIYVQNASGNATSNYPFTFLPTNTNPLSEGDVVINKVYNADDADGSGDAVEILVVKDHADLRGLYFKDWKPGKNGGLLTFFFREIPLFSDVRAGTLIVARNSATSADVSFSSTTDFNLDLGLQDLNYFNAGNASASASDHFDIGSDDIMSLQKGASGTTGILAMLGSGPTVVNLLAPLPTGTQSSFNSGIYTRLNGSATVTPGKYVYVTNRTSDIVDYKHVGATANANYVATDNADRIKSDVTMNDDAVPAALVLGTPNNATNLAYITALRSAVLPVSLISFTAKTSTNGVELNWATASEQNSSRFEVQRSADGNSFTTIKTVSGANNSNTRNNYSFTDRSPLSGVNYYQLVQIDNNGTAKNLGLQAVNSDLKSLAFNVSSYGNANQVNYNVYATAAGEASVKIFSASGTQVANATVTLVEGNNSLKLASTLRPGVYVAVLTAENSTLTTKFIK